MRFPSLPLLAAALLLMGCAKATPYNPFLVPQEDVRRTVRTIAMTSTRVPTEAPAPDSISRAYSQFLVAELEAGGFQVIWSPTVDSVWQSLSDTVQLFDPKTGAADSVKFASIERAMARFVRDSLGADAWLSSWFIVYAAPFDDGWVHWDGARQYLESTGSTVLLALTGRSRSGTVRVLSLRTDLVDPDGRRLFLNDGGVIALTKFTAGGPEPLGPREAFSNAERNQEAVRLALKPLTRPTKK